MFGGVSVTLRKLPIATVGESARFILQGYRAPMHMLHGHVCRMFDGYFSLSALLFELPIFFTLKVQKITFSTTTKIVNSIYWIVYQINIIYIFNNILSIQDRCQSNLLTTIKIIQHITSIYYVSFIAGIATKDK